MNKIKVLLFVLMSFIVTYSGNAWAGGCSESESVMVADPSANQQGEATKAIQAAIPVFIVQKQQSVVMELITKNPDVVFEDVSGDNMEKCQGEDRDEIICPLIFQKIMENLSKLLSVSYRMSHSIHIFNPNKVKYSPELAQQIASVMLAGKK